jgi:hypothetical protein
MAANFEKIEPTPNDLPVLFTIFLQFLHSPLTTPWACRAIVQHYEKTIL